jgi:DnaJ family protein A protein 5
VQSAYEILSDPQERAWYDSHRESILRGDGATEEYEYEHSVHLTSAADLTRLMGRFTTNIPFTVAYNGFYGIAHATFQNLAAEEDSACVWQGIETILYPEFGGPEEDYDEVVKPFYRVWMNFSTKKTFSWRDAYRSSDAPDRATRRVMDKENRRLRDEAIREFNDTVRALVAFVRKRDPRYVPNSQSEADRQKILRDAAAAQAARSRAANLAKLDKQAVPDWAKTEGKEEEGAFSDSSESEVEEIECVVCNKTFKSEKQYEAHEKSKKHVKAVQALQREMRKENKRLNLDNPSDTAPTAPVETVDALEGLKIDSQDGELTNEPLDDTNQDNDAEPSGLSTPDTEDEEDDASQNEPVENKAEKATEADSGSSDADDEYASREKVENRLASTLPGSGGKDSEVATPGTPSALSDSENNSSSKKPLGKAKAKKAKKAARQAMEAEAGQKVSSEIL